MTDPLRRFTRPQRARLRELAGAAWEAELVTGLERLHADFERWAADRLSAFELTDRIHGFHDGTARELYNRYSRLDPVSAVAAAIARGLLDERTIDAALLEQLQPDIACFRRAIGDESP